MHETTTRPRRNAFRARVNLGDGEAMRVSMAGQSRGEDPRIGTPKSRASASVAHGLLQLLLSVSFLAPIPVGAQQVPDTLFQPKVTPPAFAAAKGPRIGIDEAHHNFHTAIGRYRPFARLAERDGYRIIRVTGALTDQRLSGIDLLVIANPLNAINDGDNWSLPTPSAYTPDEVKAVRRFVERGGALLLIADHMPFAGAAEALGAAFDVRYYNGYAQTADATSIFTLRRGSTLRPHPVTDGRSAAERIDSLVVFTGSAFGLLKNGAAVLSLPSDTRVLLPSTAWVFTASTPSVPSDGLLYGAALTVGAGRVFVAGEAAMFSAQRSGPQGDGLMGFNRPSASQNAQFALNVLHWLTRVF